jgi:hypothetical protein
MRDELKENIDMNENTKNGNIDSREVNDINVPHAGLCSLDKILDYKQFTPYLNPSKKQIGICLSDFDVIELKQQLINLVKQAKPELTFISHIESLDFISVYNTAIKQYEANLLKALE